MDPEPASTNSKPAQGCSDGGDVAFCCSGFFLDWYIYKNLHQFDRVSGEISGFATCNLVKPA